MDRSNPTNWGGIAVVVLAIVAVGLVVAAFILGSTTSEQLQWLNPDIAKAIANFKQQQARNLELLNDKLQEEIRGLRIDNNKRQALADAEVEDKRAWNATVRQLAQMLIGAIADGLRILVAGATLIGVILVYRRYGDSTPQPARVRNPLLRFRPAATSTRTFAFEVEKAADLIPSPANVLLMHPETPEERQRHSCLREMARRHEIEYRQVLASVQAEEGGDAMI